MTWNGLKWIVIAGRSEGIYHAEGRNLRTAMSVLEARISGIAANA